MLGPVVATGILLDERAHASVNLQLHHWVYEAVDRLVALRLIDRAMISTKPYSRLQAAKYVATAIERIRANEVKADGREVIAEQWLNRLMTELRSELERLGTLSRREKASDRAFRYGGRSHVEFDSFFIGSQVLRFRPNRKGEFYADGVQVQSDVRGWLEYKDLVALSLNPKVISMTKELGFDNTKNLYLRGANAKFTFKNVTFQAGRSSLWWGPGYHGSLLMTDFAFPLDMLQLGSEEPFRLPWLLSRLGTWKIQSFLTRLQDDRHFPNAQVFGLRIDYMPTKWLELGISRLTQFDGTGHPGNAWFPKTVVETYGAFNTVGTTQVNEQIAIDFRATIPKVPYLIPFPAGLQWYGEFGSEDDFPIRPDKSQPFSTLAAMTGIYIPQLIRKGVADLRIELAWTDLTPARHCGSSPGCYNNWYNNSTFTSGMRYKNGFPLGYSMGTDAREIYVRMTRPLSESLYLATHYNFQQRRWHLPVHETKNETGVDLTWWITDRMQWSFSYWYQRIKNPGNLGQGASLDPFNETFASGVTSNNHLLWTTFAFSF